MIFLAALEYDAHSRPPLAIALYSLFHPSGRSNERRRTKSIMDNDPCADIPLWSVLNSAVPDLTLAGVLAGFLIAVVAALVVQWYDRASPRMIALFASGVPALMISSYLFSIESGAKPPRGIESCC
jgi:hypothetical protein